jgi:hypothetical protein
MIAAPEGRPVKIALTILQACLPAAFSYDRPQTGN